MWLYYNLEHFGKQVTLNDIWYDWMNRIEVLNK